MAIHLYAHRHKCNLAECSAHSQDFGNTLTIHPELQKVFSPFNSYEQPHRFLPHLQPSLSVQSCSGCPGCSRRVIQAVTTFMLRSSPLCLSNNRNRLMKIEHLTLKAFTAGIHLSDLRSVTQVCVFRYHRAPDSLSTGVKASAPLPPPSPLLPLCNSHFSLVQRVSDKAKCLNSEYCWWENPLFFYP